MTFSKLAYSQAVLRSTASPAFVKRAGLALGAAKRVGGFIAKHPAATLGTAAAVGLGAQQGISKAREYRQGFDPNYQAMKMEMSG